MSLLAGKQSFASQFPGFIDRDIFARFHLSDASRNRVMIFLPTLFPQGIDCLLMRLPFHNEKGAGRAGMHELHEARSRGINSSRQFVGEFWSHAAIVSQARSPTKSISPQLINSLSYVPIMSPAEFAGQVPTHAEATQIAADRIERTALSNCQRYSRSLFASASGIRSRYLQSPPLGTPDGNLLAFSHSRCSFAPRSELRRSRLFRRDICVVADHREQLLTGNDAGSAVFETISGDAEFRRVRALAYVDLNRNIGGRLDPDWKPRAGDLRNVGLELSCRQTRRTRRRFTDDNFSVSLSFINKKLVLGFHLRRGKTDCADDGKNSKRLLGDVSGIG